MAGRGRAATITCWWAALFACAACAGNAMKMAAPEAGASAPRDGATQAIERRDASTGHLDSGAEASDRDASSDGAAALPPLGPPTELRPAPMSLISVRKKVVTSAGTGSFLVDDSYFDQGFWDVTVESQPWAALDLGRGPTRIFVQLYALEVDSAPRAYRLETSPDSSNGRDGTWTARVQIANNEHASRVHVLEFTEQRWLRIVVEQGSAGRRVRLNELGVRDASQGTSDSWIFLGDSITATTLHPGRESFSARVHEAHPAYYPIMINGGVGGASTSDCLNELDTNLAAYPEVQNWVVGYGTNDSASGDSHAAEFGKNLRAIVDRLQRAGKSVFIPRIPYKSDGDVTPYNRVLDEVVASTGASPGPDLHAYFTAHEAELYDGVHPNDQGGAAINRLWSEAVAPLYR